MEAGDTLTAWWRSLARAPEALTRRERWAVIAATLLTAITRWLALARTPWDWDEILFQAAMQRYDVAQHRPHPPGFPLFILAADAVRDLTGWSDFHALQAVSFVAAIAIVPAMVFLCRELRMRFDASLAAALLLAFAPNVWFFGGGAFSDVPSMTLVVVAIALLLRGCRDVPSLFAGAALAGIAAGFRPQNLLVVAAPFLIAASHQGRRNAGRVIAAALVIVAIVALSFGGAAAVTGVDRYRAALATHQRYITATDSFVSPTRPPLWRVADDFFFWPYRALPINLVVTLLAVIALVRRRPSTLAALAAFGPFCLFAWLLLDYHSTSRFSIGYAPLFALLAADGLAILPRRASWAGAAALLALMFAWTFPSLRIVHDTPSPPIAAIAWIRAHIDPHRAITLVRAELVPYAERELDGFETRYVSGEGAVWGMPYRRGAILEEGDHGGVVFRRDRKHLEGIARDRYFEVSATPLRENVDFRDGWSGEERDGKETWRWMGARSVTILPALPRATLELALDVPRDLLPSPPTITIYLNGVVLERIVGAPRTVARRYEVAPRAGANELVIETDRTGRAAGDDRDLGVRLDAIGWLPELR